LAGDTFRYSLLFYIKKKILQYFYASIRICIPFCDKHHLQQYAFDRRWGQYLSNIKFIRGYSTIHLISLSLSLSFFRSAVDILGRWECKTLCIHFTQFVLVVASARLNKGYL
jgi:hypothetical protein